MPFDNNYLPIAKTKTFSIASERVYFFYFLGD